MKSMKSLMDVSHTSLSVFVLLLSQPLIRPISMALRRLFTAPTSRALFSRHLSASAAAASTPASSSTDQNQLSVVFSIADQPGLLLKALEPFSRSGINLTRIESRPSKPRRQVNGVKPTFDFFIDLQGSSEEPRVKTLLSELRQSCTNVSVVASKEVPWFPRHISDLDLISQNVLGAGAELESDHPGFHDKEYRSRRKQIAEAAVRYSYGQEIYRVPYSKEEVAAWGVVWDRLKPLLDKHACSEYTALLPLFEKHCGYSRNNIPQLEDLSKFLKERTGFSLRPVGGLLSARDFLNGLAFRVFFSTQYLRHHSRPLYTPEPDVVHELMGHAPLFADPEFADFSQEIGLASIGASDAQITQLARCYWFSVEFGLCEQNGQRKAYGAGLLSSFGELEYSMSEKPKVLSWDPFDASTRDYPITTYQPVYYMAKSFEDAKLQMRSFADSLHRPFHVSYNANTQSLQVDRALRVMGHAPPKPSATGPTM